MKIQEKDLFHGSALTQIVEHPSFKALNKADSKYGHYQINNNTRILIKYRTNETSPWIFTIKEEDVDTLIQDIDSQQASFLCLVCGNTTICILSTIEYEKLLDVSKKKEQWLRVDLPPRSSMRIKSATGRLPRPIKNNSFPDILFNSK